MNNKNLALMIMAGFLISGAAIGYWGYDKPAELCLLSLGIGIGLLSIAIPKPKVLKRATRTIIEARNVPCRQRYNDQIQITFSNGDVIEYIGSSTVWFQLPLMERADTLIEGKLCEIQKYIKEYGNPYPTAHKKHEDENTEEKKA